MRIQSTIYNNKYHLILILVITCFISCSKSETKVPSDIIAKDSMVYIMMDIHLAEAGLKSVPADTIEPLNIKNYYDAIYKKHNTNDSVFNRSLKFYTEHPELLEQIYQKITEEMSRKEAEVLK